MAIRSATWRPAVEAPVFESLPAIKRIDVIMGVLGCLTLAGVVAGMGRLLLGLGPTTGLNDIFSWGIWIGFDFGLIAFAGAGFTMAAVVHIFHFERFHAALWPAILAGFMGYTAVLALLVLDLGRPDRFYNFMIYWNLHSPLFEISCCVLLYTTVLVIEVSPHFLARLPWRRTATLIKVIKWFMLPVTIIGVTLSTLHQSTLGTLYLNMPQRLHPLWYTPLLPPFFYISSIMAGLSMGVLAYRVAMRVLRRTEDAGIVSGLCSAAVVTGLIYAVAKLAELWWSGDAVLLWTAPAMGALWLAELGIGVALPALLWAVPRTRRSSLVQWLVPMLVLASVLMNRFDATLYGQVVPATVPPYSPHLLEWISTIGILAAALLAWLVGIRFFSGSDHAGTTH